METKNLKKSEYLKKLQNNFEKKGFKSASVFSKLCIVGLLKQNPKLRYVCKKLGCKENSLNYHVSTLKRQGYIKKIGYGTWEVLKDFNPNNFEKTSAVAPKQLRKKEDLKTWKQDSIRGHSFQFTLKIPKLKNWHRRREYLYKNNINYINVGSNWQGERILINNFKVWLTPVSIIVYFPKSRSFMGNIAQDTRNHAIYEFKAIISKVEQILNISFKIRNDYKFKVSRQHYALIKNSLARQYDKEGNKLFCYSAGGLWFIIDNSYNLHEAETVNPQTAIPDNNTVLNFFNDLKENPITPSQILKIQYNQAKNFDYYAEHIKTHTGAMIGLNKGIEKFNIGINTMIKLLKDMGKK